MATDGHVDSPSDAHFTVVLDEGGAPRAFRVDARIEVERLVGRLLGRGAGTARLHPYGTSSPCLELRVEGARVRLATRPASPDFAGWVALEAALDVCIYFYDHGRLPEAVAWIEA